MTEATLVEKAEKGYSLTEEESFELYDFPLPVLMYCADIVRKRLNPSKTVTYIIDRNINITNVCFSFCAFCNFCRKSDDTDVYITTRQQYEQKIEELYSKGGKQVLLQGGMHPELGLDFYVELFQWLKQRFPDLYLHALSPPEIIYLARRERVSVRFVLEQLRAAGLDSLPGGGAEILVDSVREKISPLKATSSEWLEVMRIAHQMNILTTATMMFGHIETRADRIRHMLKIRELQEESQGIGFISFIPWTFQRYGTRLERLYRDIPETYASEYLKTLAISRLILHNIQHIQASWLTAGTDIAQIALHSGADDLGGLMLEENVVASTGVRRTLSEEEMHQLISDAGFIPALRDQHFRLLQIFH